MAPPIQSCVRKFATQQRIAQADEDMALLAQVAVKDMRAFEALYRNYQRRLTRFLERITRQTHLIEEILDDTMLVVWLQAQRYDRSCRVSTWIFSIAYNKAMKAIKRAGRPFQALSDMESVAADNGPEAESIERESRHRMRELLALLPPEQCAVIELTYFYGYSYTEIARIVDCPVGTVKTRMFHARRKLGNMLTTEPEQ